MKKAVKKIGSLALAALLAMGLCPLTASAAVGIQENAPVSFALNSDTVGFAGREWYVIGTDSGGVTAPADHITLLSKSSFGGSAFRTGNSTQDDPSWTEYSGGWYEGDFNLPNDYNGSTLMNVMATATNALPAKEAALITARDIGTDGIGGTAVNNQKLWPLSLDEYTAMGSIPGDPFTSDVWNSFWLRSPENTIHACLGFSDGGGGFANVRVDASVRPGRVRPALQLNLASVLFTSDASGANVKSAAVGGNLTSAQAAAQNLKFTMLDSGLSLHCTDAAPRIVRIGDTVSISYSGATTGAKNYVSCVIVDSSGDITHYGKLSQAANGTASFTVLTEMTPGNYTIRLFSEECNGDNETDFASTPIDIPMTIEGAAADASLTVTAPTLASETAGYTQPAAQAITIANSGGVDAAVTSIVLSGANPNAFEIGGSGSTVSANSSLATWTVRPKAGLAAATYNAQIDVTYANGGTNTTASDAVSFTVDPKNGGGGVPDPAAYTSQTLTDPATGVTVTGSFLPNARLTVTPKALHAAGACAACDSIRAEQKAGNVLALYDISVSTGHSGSVEISIPVGSKYSGKILTMLHCKNGTLEEREMTVQSGTATGSFTSFSPFAVLKTASNASLLSVPKTGDSSNMGPWLMLMGASLALSGLAAWRLRKKRGAAQG